MDFSEAYRVTDAWAEKNESGDGYWLDLDLAGVLDGSRLKLVDGATFSLAAAMLAVGPAYIQGSSVLSSDPYFGSKYAAEEEVNPPLEVIEMDAVWDFDKQRGGLLLTLENHSLTYLQLDDPGAVGGWLLTARAHTVLFDGTNLKSRREDGSTARSSKEATAPAVEANSSETGTD